MSGSRDGGQTAEALVGAAVLAVAAVFLAYAFSHSGGGGGPAGGYAVTALFDRANGVAPGVDVRMAGVKIGAVQTVGLFAETNQAKVDLVIQDGVAIPDDSTVVITQDGILGQAYVSVEPGSSETTLAAGGEFTFTQGSVDLITLFAQAAGGGGGAE